MDSFYASAEVLRRPELRGRPVVVGADPKKGTGRGVACTCSYEARAFGIRSAMPVSQAYILCPHAVFLPPDFPYYAGVSRAIMDELRSYGFPVLQVSIDEAYLDISACGHFGAAREIAQELRAAIHRRTGLTCSVGVAPGKVLAKIASDYQKPGGCTVIEPPRAQEFLSPLPVRKIPGVGRRAEAEFLELGIRTIGDLSRSDIQCLIGRFGRGAASLHSLASGIDGSGLEEPGDIRSVSRETTFDSDCSDPVELLRQLDHLTTAACRNLAEGSLRCRTVTIKIRYQGFITRTKSRTLPEYTDAEAPLLSCSRALFAGIFDGRKVRLLGVRLSSLTRPDHSQRTLGV
jgi:DNA polymerase IV (DinB-like DNA polymerase)